MKLTPIKANMTEVQIGKVRVLFSYQTPVATHCQETDSFKRTSKKWSSTTTRHINHWLDGTRAEEIDQDFFDNLVS